MQTIQRPSATVSRLLQSAQVPDVPWPGFKFHCALNQASDKLTIFKHDEIVIVREARDEIPDSLFQVAQTQVDDHANDTANDGGPYVGRTVETRARGVMCADWRCRI
jgi:hypothetical protein